ncbi:U3 snoRNP protein, partial [Cymbomonas tetramitiformis]
AASLAQAGRRPSLKLKPGGDPRSSRAASLAQAQAGWRPSLKATWAVRGCHRGRICGLQRAGTARFLPATPVPEKILMNLTTKIDSLAFSPDSQILAMSSTMKKDSLRLVHLPSYTVFSNWPTSKTPLHFVSSLAFSPGGGYLAIGNAKGRVLLYRLHHYSRA